MKQFFKKWQLFLLLFFLLLSGNAFCWQDYLNFDSTKKYVPFSSFGTVNPLVLSRQDIKVEEIPGLPTFNPIIFYDGNTNHWNLNLPFGRYGSQWLQGYYANYDNGDFTYIMLDLPGGREVYHWESDWDSQTRKVAVPAAGQEKGVEVYRNGDFIERYSKDGSKMVFKMFFRPQFLKPGERILFPVYIEDRFGHRVSFEFINSDGTNWKDILPQKPLVLRDELNKLDIIKIKNPGRNEIVIKKTDPGYSSLRGLIDSEYSVSSFKMYVNGRENHYRAEYDTFNSDRALNSVKIYKDNILEREDNYKYSMSSEDIVVGSVDGADLKKKVYSGDVKLTTSEYGANAYTLYSMDKNLLKSVEQKVFDGETSKTYKTYFDYEVAWKGSGYRKFHWTAHNVDEKAFVIPLSQDTVSYRVTVDHKEVGNDGVEKLVKQEFKTFNAWGKLEEHMNGSIITSIGYNEQGQPTFSLNMDSGEEKYIKDIRYSSEGTIISVKACSSDGCKGTKSISYGKYNVPNSRAFHIYPKIIAFPDGRITEYKYDYDESEGVDLNDDGITNQRFGNVILEKHIGMTSKLTETLVFSYDSKGRLAKQGILGKVPGTFVYGISYHKGFSYDNNGKIKSDFNFSGNEKKLETRYAYDSFGRKVAERNPEGVETLYKYNSADQVIKTYFGCTDSKVNYYFDSQLPDFDTVQCSHARNYDYDKTGNLVETKYYEDYYSNSNGQLEYHPSSLRERKLLTTYNSAGLPFKTCKLSRRKIPLSGATYLHKDTCISVEHDMFGNVVREEKNGNVREIKYNHGNNPVEIRENGLILERLNYERDGKKPKYICDRYSINNNESQNCYNSDQRQEITYDGYGRPIETKDPFGIRTVKTYDKGDRVLSVITYSKNNLRTSEVHYDYDDLGRLWKEKRHTFVPTDKTKPEIITEKEYSYDLLGNISEIRDSLGNIKENVYDHFNRIKEVKIYNGDSLSSKKTSIYSEGTSETRAGRLYKSILEKGGKTITTYYDYDVLGRTIRTCKESEGEKRCSYKVYNTGGQVIWTADEESHVDSEISWWTDRYGDLFTDTSERFGNETFYGYTPGGEIAFVSYKMDDPINPFMTVDYEYDTLGRIKEKVNDNGGKTTYEYYSSGNDKGKLHTMTIYPGNVDSNVTVSKYQKYTYFYNDKSDLVRTTWEEEGSEPVTVSLELDKFGRVVKRTASGNSEKSIIQSYGYNDSNLLDVAKEGNFTVYRSYDSNGDIFSEHINGLPGYEKWKQDASTTVFKYPNGKIKRTTVEDGRLKKITYNNKTIANYSYLDGQLSSISKGNGVVERFGFNKWNKLESKTAVKLYKDPVVNFKYDYTRSWHLNEKTDLVENRTENYSYDPYYRLKNVDYGNGNTESFKLDGVHNITESRNNSVKTEWFVDAFNRVAGKTGPETVEYGYDSRNNLDYEMHVKNNSRNDYDELVDYEYDVLNRLVSVTKVSKGEYYPFKKEETRTADLGVRFDLVGRFDDPNSGGKFFVTYKDFGEDAMMWPHRLMDDGTYEELQELSDMPTKVTDILTRRFRDYNVVTLYSATNGYRMSFLFMDDGRIEDLLIEEDWPADNIATSFSKNNKYFYVFHNSGKISVESFSDTDIEGGIVGTVNVGINADKMHVVEGRHATLLFLNNSVDGSLKIYEMNDSGLPVQPALYDGKVNEIAGHNTIASFNIDIDQYLMFYSESDASLKIIDLYSASDINQENGFGRLVYSGNTDTKFSSIITAPGSGQHDLVFGLHNYGRVGLLKFVDNEEGPVNQAVKLAEYTYDAFNRRIVKDAGNKSQIFLYDDWNIIADMTKKDGNFVAQRSYIDNGMDNHIAVSVMGKTGTEQLYYYHKDERGNVLNITNSNGDSVANYRYGVYGRFLKKEEALLPFENNFYWGGSYLDEETGLYWMRHRYYHIGLKRFINQDPIGIWGDSNNLGNGFAYVAGRVPERIDPTGLVDPLNAVILPLVLYFGYKIIDKVFESKDKGNNSNQTNNNVNINIHIHNNNNNNNSSCGSNNGNESNSNAAVGPGTRGESDKVTVTLPDGSTTEADRHTNDDGSYVLTYKDGDFEYEEHYDANGKPDYRIVTEKDGDDIYEYVQEWDENCKCWKTVPKSVTSTSSMPADPNSLEKMQEYFMSQILKDILRKKGLLGGSIGDDEYWEIVNDDYQRNPGRQIVYNPFYKGKDPLKEVYWKIDRDDTGRPLIWRNPLAPTPFIDTRPVWEKLGSQGIFIGNQPDPAPNMTTAGISIMPFYY